ncbi:MAG: nucleotidyltransferase domain-containing protein, partial [Thermoproteus sp.]
VGLEALGELLAELAKRLSLPEDYIDLLIVNERTPCPLVLEALRGVPLYVADWDEVYRYFNICQDQQIDSRKLALLETALESIWRG